MTLLMRDQENIEKGIKKGIEQGIEQGIEKGIKKGIEQGIEKGKIYGAVSMCRELGLSEGEILERLQKKYCLTKSEAEMYMQETIYY